MKKENKNKKKNNKIIFIIIGVVLFLALLACLIWFITKPVPFVIRENIEILDAKGDYSNPVYLYATAQTGEQIKEGINFKDSKAEYKFYDLKKETDGEYDIYTFKQDITISVEYTKTYKGGRWTYSFSQVDPMLFDYYTGEEYNKGMAVTDNSLIGIAIGSSEANMGMTTIKWNNNEYEIGVLEEYSSKWDGNKKLSGDGDNAVYGDTSRSTALFTVKVPKDYDGVMVAILKRGSNEESYEKYKVRYDKYQELLKDYENTGEKSKELIEFEEDQFKVRTILESINDKNLIYTKNDYIVFRMSEIEKIK